MRTDAAGVRTARLRLQERLESSLTLHARQPALEGPDGTVWTFGDLDQASHAWKERLEQAGAPLDLPVALALPRGPELVAAVLGVLRAGGAYLCMDTAGETGDSAAQPKDWGAGTQLDESGLRILPPHRPAAPPAAPHPAFALVRTSGSTGAPRGILQNPAGLLRHVDHWVRLTGIRNGSRLSWLSPPGTAAAHSHLFAALLHGATLCPQDIRACGISGLTAWLLRRRISHLHLTPSVLRAWLGSLDAPLHLPELRVVKLGGEPAWGSDAALLHQRLLPPPRLFNGLGMTEANGNIALHEIHPLELQPALLPAGPPVPGLRVRITRRWRLPWNPGSAGEIVVTGPDLSLGPWPRPDARGLGDAATPVRRIRTGDRGRLKDGVLTHLGRLDRQISHRGRQLDLHHLEAQAAKLQPVRQAAALPHPDGTGYLLGLVIQPDTPALRTALRKALAGQLAAPPRRLAFFPHFPLLPGGKLDAAALRQSWPAPAPRSAFHDHETALRALWMDVLGHDDFGPEDTFLEAGGDSLSALQLLARAEKAFGIRLGAAEFIRHPTVRSLNRLLRDGSRPSAEAAAGLFEISWVELDESPGSAPVLMSPGGWNSDQELWLAAGLLGGLRTRRTLACTRTNLAHPFAAAPRNFADLLHPLLPRLDAHPAPVLIGGCISTPLVLWLAAEAVRRGKQPLLLLIDPLLHGMPGRRPSSAPPPVPERVRDYYRLLRETSPPPDIRIHHLFLAQEDPDLATRVEAWKPLLVPGGRIHHLPGNHHSCLRAHQAAAARAVASVLDPA